MTTSKDNWDTFLTTGAEYMAYVNNRQPGVSPSAGEFSALSTWSTIYNSVLSSGQRAQYAAMGGPNIILQHVQAIGGLRMLPVG